MATKLSGNFEIRYHCLISDNCLRNMPTKTLIQIHIEEYHKNYSGGEYELRYHCLKDNCKFITDKKIKIRAHLQKHHDVIEDYQSVHLKQALRVV